MPYLKFDSPKAAAGNKGSCGDFINYLSKEDFSEGKLSKEFLFNHNSRLIPDYEAIELIDSNRKGLGKNDSKFYTGSINFSEEELNFIGNDTNLIKDYTVMVMNMYASNFNREVSIDDLVWFAKVEQKRYYKGDDPEVIAGIQLQGAPKEGLQTHVHFIVGRKTMDGSRKISPKTNHVDTQKGPVKGGFSRDSLKMQTESLFDGMFGYLRPLEQSYEYSRIRANGSVHERETVASMRANELVKRESYLTQPFEQREYRIRQLSNYICHGVNRDSVKRIDVDRLIEWESTKGYAGFIYRSLVNLNRACKQGKTPEKYDLTDMVIGFARHLEFREGQIEISRCQEHTKPIVFEPITPAESIPDYSFWLPPSGGNPRKYDENDLDLSRRKKKKKGRGRSDNSQDYGMGM